MTKPMTQAEKDKRKAERESEPEVTVLKPELATDTKTLTQRLRDDIAALQNRREQLDMERNDLDSQLAELRELIGGGQEEEESPAPRKPRKQTTSNGRRGRGSSDKTLEEHVFLLLKKAGKKGLSQEAVAQALLDQGYETPSNFEQFSKSVYVSGIWLLTKKGWASRFSVEDERKGRYRLTSNAPSSWTR